MKLLILGHSSIVRRRVAPALRAIGLDFEIASRTSDAAEVAYRDYGDALARSDAGLVYVSTVNSTHAQLAAAALESGRHVVIDKPAALSLDDVHQLVGRAAAQHTLIAEATVWSYHPQVAAAKELFGERGPERLVATFSIPPMPPENFRMQHALGGGALWDLGPYAVSMGRVFFGAAPDEIVAGATGNGEVDLAFTTLMTYPGGRSAAGHFGMTTAYVNKLEVLGPAAAVTLDPAFTTAPDAPSRLHVNERNQRRTIDLPPASSFAAFFTAVLAAISDADHAGFAEAMLADGETLERLRLSSRA